LELESTMEGTADAAQQWLGAYCRRRADRRRAATAMGAPAVRPDGEETRTAVSGAWMSEAFDASAARTGTAG